MWKARAWSRARSSISSDVKHRDRYQMSETSSFLELKVQMPGQKKRGGLARIRTGVIRNPVNSANNSEPNVMTAYHVLADCWKSRHQIVFLGLNRSHVESHLLHYETTQAVFTFIIKKNIYIFLQIEARLTAVTININITVSVTRVKCPRSFVRTMIRALIAHFAWIRLRHVVILILECIALCVD